LPGAIRAERMATFAAENHGDAIGMLEAIHR
jgi:hypothetical protein